MPYRHLFRQNEGSHDFHNHHGFQRPLPQQLAIVDPDSVEYHGWHEMDFTTAPLDSPSTVISDSHQHQQGLLHQKYAATTLTTMDRDPLDSLAYLRSTNHRQTPQKSPDAQTISGDLFSGDGPFSYSQLLNMDQTLSPMDQSSLSSSSHTNDGDSNMLNGNDDNRNNNNLTHRTLSMSDSLDTSPPVATLDPIAISIASKPDSTEKLCPLIAGQVDSCQPQRCGPDAPCMNFTTLPPIEECTSVPCITAADNSPNETMITSDGMSVSLHSRPSVSTRTTTSTSNTSRSSAAVRRSSSGSSNDGGTHVKSVPLPPRRSAAAAARRRTRTTTDAVKRLATSDDEEDVDLRQPPSKTTATLTKVDAKQRAKQAHSLVERKYRENLNAKIAQLHNTLQSSHYGPKVGEEVDSDTPNAGPTSANNAALPSTKVRKSDVLTEAMNYVNQTEVEMRHMENEIHRLSERVRVLEKLVRCEDCSLLKQMVNLQVQTI